MIPAVVLLGLTLVIGGTVLGASFFGYDTGKARKPVSALIVPQAPETIQAP